MRKIKFDYKWTECEDYNLPNNNYGEETGEAFLVVGEELTNEEITYQ